MDLSQGNTTDSIFRQSTGFCRLSFFCSILLPYIPFPMRQPLILFTKFLELMECINCPRNRFNFGHAQTMDSADAISDIFAKLSPFLSEQERSQFSQMQNMMQMLKLYQTFQEFAPFMNAGAGGDASPMPDLAQAFAQGAGFGTPPSGSKTDPPSGEDSQNNMGNMLFSMLSPDQKEMFENLKTVMSKPPEE